jgi:AraC-like DNA-binding protein/mannose-6-phosphate isomerase-like protein (cupin superfamily)
MPTPLIAGSGLPTDLVQSIPNRHALAHVLLPPPPFYIFSAARFAARDPSASLMHSHPCVCLHGCLNGSITLTTDQGNYPLAAGSFCLIGPDVPHAWQNESGRPATTVGLWLDPTRGEGPRALNQLVQQLHHFDVAYDAELHSIFWHVTDHLLAPQPRHPLATTGLLLALSGLLVERLQGGLESTEPDRDTASAIRAFLLSRLSHPPRLTDVARSVGLSSRQAERLFRAAFGQSIMSYFMQERLARAEQLLKTGRHSVEDVSRRLGFSSPTHFSRAFRQHHGVPPGQIRRQRVRPPTDDDPTR